MTPAKLRVLASGLLVLCLCALLPDDGLSLTQLVAAAGAWACLVWLWCWDRAAVLAVPEGLRSMTGRLCKLVPWRFVFILLVLAIGAGTGANSAAQKWNSERDQILAAVRTVREVNEAVKWYAEPAEALYAEVLEWREWRAQMAKKTLFSDGQPERALAALKEVNELTGEARSPKPFDLGFREPRNKDVATKDTFTEIVNAYRWNEYSKAKGIPVGQ